MTNWTKIVNANSLTHCRIAAKMSFLCCFLLFFPTRFAHALYSSRMIDRFLNWGDQAGRSWKAEKRQDRRPLPAPPGAPLLYIIESCAACHVHNQGLCYMWLYVIICDDVTCEYDLYQRVPSARFNYILLKLFDRYATSWPQEFLSERSVLS